MAQSFGRGFGGSFGGAAARVSARPVQRALTEQTEAGRADAGVPALPVMDAFLGEVSTHVSHRPENIPSKIWESVFPADRAALVRRAGVEYMKGVRPMSLCAEKAAASLVADGLHYSDPADLRFRIHDALHEEDLRAQEIPPEDTNSYTRRLMAIIAAHARDILDGKLDGCLREIEVEAVFVKAGFLSPSSLEEAAAVLMPNETTQVARARAGDFWLEDDTVPEEDEATHLQDAPPF